MSNTGNYKPVSCVFYDHLEADATLGVVSEIEYTATEGNIEHIKERIIDLVIENKIEFMVLDNNKRIRLDSILRFNGINPLEPCKS